jgi:hypothetical protein
MLDMPKLKSHKLQKIIFIINMACFIGTTIMNDPCPDLLENAFSTISGQCTHISKS